MADYNVGNLIIDLSVESDKMVSSLNKAIRVIKKVEKVDLQKTKAQFDSLTQSVAPFFEAINKATQGFNGDPLKNVSSSLNKAINTIKKLENIDLQKTQEQFTKLTQAVKPFLDELEKAAPNLKNFSNAVDLGKFNNQLKKVQATSQKTVKNLFNVGKIIYYINVTKRLSQAVLRMLESSVDFEETLNKFQVSMGEYYSEAVKFVNNLTYAFNLSTESIMNYQATFKNMLDAIGGLGGNTSYKLSETLTRMAIDYASLFNVSIERAMEQFQSVLSGQIRAVRTTAGYDVSEASIFKIYQELGGTKTIRQLDQLEKRLLRIIAVQQQMERTGAVDDFQKTINKTAQQMKQLQEVLKEVGMWLGKLAQVYLSSFIEKALAGAIALREMLKALNIAKGYKFEAAGQGGLFGDIEESADEASEAVENLKSDLLGFDKLNILGSSSSTSTITHDYDKLIEKIKEYKSNLDGVSNKANEISEKILTWLGYTKDISSYIDEDGNKIEQISWKLKDGNTNLGKIKSTLEAIGIIVGGWIASKKLAGLVTTLKNISGAIGVSAGKIVLIGAVVGLVIKKFKEMFETNSEFRQSITSTISSIKEKLKDIWDIIKPVVDFITEMIVIGLEKALKSVDILLGMIKSILKLDFKGFFKGIGDLIKNAFDWEDLWNKFYYSKVGQFLFVTIPDFFAVTLPNFFKGVFNSVKNFFTKTIPSFFEELWRKVKNMAIRGLNGIISIAEGIVNLCIGLINKMLNPFIKSLNVILKLFDKKIDLNPISEVTFSRIPELANGGVVSSPTMAMVGEYAGANSNPEIVTPENLMRQVFVESMLPIAQAIMSGDKQVISAIEDLANRPIELNGRKVSENIYDDLEKTAIRKGRLIFAK